MKSLYRYIKEHSVVYVTRDIERALGIPPKDGYFIITNRTPYSELIHAEYKDNVWLIDNPKNELYDTHELLNLPGVKQTLNETNPCIVVFKNTPLIEKVCRDHNWRLMNPSAGLAEKVEHKISQIEWLEELAELLPPHSVVECKELSWEGEPFIIQFNRSHTGEGTIFVQNEDALVEIQDKFPSRFVKKSAYIPGPVFTSNIAVFSSSILAGNINYQITGLPPFTEIPFSTIGNDWELPKRVLSPDMISAYEHIAEQVALKMQASGWKGLFGIDVKVDTSTGKVYLLEINARQPASTTYESYLQSLNARNGAKGLTTFEAHLSALFEIPTAENLIPISTGSQIIQRVTSSYTNGGRKVTGGTLESLIQKGFNVIPYNNAKPNADLVRIQIGTGIMHTYDTLNDLGKTVVSLLNSN